MDAERLSKNVSVQMRPVSRSTCKTNSAKRDTAQSIKLRSTVPIENNLPSMKIDENCFKTVDNLSIFRFFRFDSTEI